jgi:hypothetical protein
LTGQHHKKVHSTQATMAEEDEDIPEGISKEEWEGLSKSAKKKLLKGKVGDLNGHSEDMHNE